MKNKTKKEKEILEAEDQEAQYRKQILYSHGFLGNAIIPKYDTGESK